MKRFVALFMGAPMEGPMPGEDVIEKGMAAWDQWMVDHADAIVDEGGPLGKTLRVTKAGIDGFKNRVTGYIIIRAESHEAAAKMFEDHPHFAIFPGESVEVMEVMPILGQ